MIQTFKRVETIDIANPPFSYFLEFEQLLKFGMFKPPTVDANVFKFLILTQPLSMDS